MAYSEFTLEKVQKAFDLQIVENLDLFASTAELEPSPSLTEFLQENAILALNISTEKARSEMIVAPILLDLRKKFKHQISLFSGVDFNVEPALGLNGTCDFIISASPEQFFVRAPVFTLVEAKKENIIAGLGQCVAEMIAARIFNEREGNQISLILGTVTSGNIWKFIQLEGQEIRIDVREYYLRDIAKILGILASEIQ
jgi:hypothetical protein